MWSVPREWIGERCYILGGGPSLASVDVSSLDGRIIATNDSFLLRPDADVLYFADPMWLVWNHDERGDVVRFCGKYVITRTKIERHELDIKCLEHDMSKPLSRDPGKLCGYCSGSNAINLAYLFGVSEIVLLGFDMHGGHWHDRHKKPSKDLYATKFIPAIEKMAIELRSDGVSVLNATKNSALTCFPMISL